MQVKYMYSYPRSVKDLESLDWNRGNTRLEMQVSEVSRLFVIQCNAFKISISLIH